MDTPNLTVADVALFPFVAVAEQSTKGELKLESYPHVKGWVDRIKKQKNFLSCMGV